MVMDDEVLLERLVAWIDARRSVAAVAAQAGEAATAAGRRAMVLGVHGPQGAGKSTLCARLVARLSARGCRAAAVSVDDFYLPRAGQLARAAAHPGNRYLEHRGYPGTHDVALGVRTLEALARPEAGVVAVPRYDKSAASGRGDRAPERDWAQVPTPLDVVLVEGWLLAFEPAPADTIPEPALAVANDLLTHYHPWRAALDALVVLEVGDHLDWIVRWRIDAERARRESGSPALSEAEAADYIGRFLPAYRLWRPTDRLDRLRVELGPDRRALRVETVSGVRG